MSASGRDTLAAQFAAGKSVVSGWVSLPEPLVAEAVVRSGFGAVLLDMQHGLVDTLAAIRGVAAIRHAGGRAAVRVPVGEVQTASRMLDVGADLVIAPMIETVEDARRFADHAKYPPLGQRSWGPTRAMQLASYEGGPLSTPDAHRGGANGATLAFAMIETLTALENLDGILALPGIDGVFVGPADLTIALSNGASGDLDSARSVEAFTEIARRANAVGKPAGIYAMSGAHAKRYLGLGFRYVTVLSDIGYIAAGAKAHLAEIG
jgi:4-hydroxy-2-oxoheptanedioate aldolase